MPLSRTNHLDSSHPQAIRPTAATVRLSPKRQLSLGLALRSGGIIEKPLAKNLVGAPFLQAHLVKPVHFAGFLGQLENPMDSYAVALDHGRHSFGIHI